MRRQTYLAAALIPCALAVSACSTSSNGASHSAAASPSASESRQRSQSASDSNIDLSSAQVAAKYMQALESATSVHAQGTDGQGSDAASLDMYGEKNGNAKGTVSSDGDSFTFISFGGTGYIQYNAQYEKMAKIDPTSQVGEMLLNNWAASNTTAGGAYNAGIAPIIKGFTNFTGLTASGDTYVYIGTTTVGGKQAAEYSDDSSTADDPEITFAVPVSGPMLPILYAPGGETDGSLTLTWNQPVQISAPPAAKLIKTIP